MIKLETWKIQCCYKGEVLATYLFIYSEKYETKSYEYKRDGYKKYIKEYINEFNMDMNDKIEVYDRNKEETFIID